MAIETTPQLRSRLLGLLERIPMVIYALILAVLYLSVFLENGLVNASESCPTPEVRKTKNLTGVHKAWSKPCVAHYEYCAPDKPPVAASCPGKLVYSPQRGRCDLRKTCKEMGQKTDLECMGKPCGLYGHIDCKKYFICAGGTRIWKTCPGDTVFDFELEICKLEGKCKYPVEPIIPSDLPPEDDIDPLDDSERAECPYHDFPEPDEGIDDDKGVPGFVIESPKVTDWGTWQPWKMCPNNTYIMGMSNWKRSTEGPDGSFDHAGVISVGFKCDNPMKKKGEKTIGQHSTGSPDSVWDFWLMCEKGVGVGFELAQQEDQGDEDDVATDNIKLICSCGVNQELFKPYHEDLEKYKKVGGQLGEWTEKRFCKEKQALCGFRGQFQDWSKGRGVNLKTQDMTGLNQMKFKCCDVVSPSKGCEPKTVKKYLQTCDNLEGFVKRPCPFDTYVGAMFSSANMSRATSFYTSIGYTMEEGFADLEETLRDKLKCMTEKGCKHQWLFGEDQDSRRMFQLAHKEGSEVNITAGVSMKLFQTVVQCGIYEIHTNQISIEGKEAKEGKELPKPELHLFEGSITHFARKKKR